MMRLIRYFTGKKQLLWRIPRAQFNQVNASSEHANRDERILIARMYARNVVEARLLMRRYNAKRAEDVIRAVGRRKKTLLQRFWRQVVRLVMKLEGAR